jgi:hypothetical protein
MFDGWTEPQEVIDARKARILATRPAPWNPTLAECLELEADISAEKRRAAEWAEIRQYLAEIRARQAQP